MRNENSLAQCLFGASRLANGGMAPSGEISGEAGVVICLAISRAQCALGIQEEWEAGAVGARWVS